MIYAKEKPSRKGVNHHICVLRLILQWFCGEWFGVTRGSGTGEFTSEVPKSRRDKQGGPKLEKGQEMKRGNGGLLRNQTQQNMVV